MTALVPIVAATMAPDTLWAVTVALDGTVRTWDSGAASRVIGRAIDIDVGQPVAVALRGGRIVRVLWATEETLRLYEHVKGARPRDDVCPVPAPVRALAFSPSGIFAVLACDDGTLRSLNVGTWEFGWTLATGPLSARAVAVASDRGLVVAAFIDGSIRRYDLEAGTSDIIGSGPPAHLITITPDGNVVVAAAAGGVLLRWKAPFGALPDSQVLGTAITTAAVDGTGDKVLVGMDDGSQWLHHLTRGPGIEFAVPPPQTEIATPPYPPSPPTGASQPQPAQPAGHRDIVDTDVRFTVYRPQLLSPGVWASLLVFAHKTSLVVETGRAPVEPNEVVEAMARAYLGDAAGRPTGEDARSGVFRGARLRIVPDLPGIQCNPAGAEFEWWEPVHGVVFRLLAGPDLVGSVVRGAVRVWCGPLLLGEVSLAISIAASGPEAGSPPVAKSAPRYRKIFPSYSHSDRALVEGFADAVHALGDHYLQDVLALRAGERWRARLLELIEDADVFQLFWSTNSMRSQYCRDEWEHALSLRRPSFVRPLYWEEPLPEDPAKGLPPVALRELHFVKVQPYSPRRPPPTGTTAPPGAPPGDAAAGGARVGMHGEARDASMFTQIGTQIIQPAPPAALEVRYSLPPDTAAFTGRDEELSRITAVTEDRRGRWRGGDPRDRRDARGGQDRPGRARRSSAAAPVPGPAAVHRPARPHPRAATRCPRRRRWPGC